MRAMTAEEVKAALAELYAASRTFQASAAGMYGMTPKLYAIAATLLSGGADAPTRQTAAREVDSMIKTATLIRQAVERMRELTRR